MSLSIPQSTPTPAQTPGGAGSSESHTCHGPPPSQSPNIPPSTMAQVETPSVCSESNNGASLASHVPPSATAHAKKQSDRSKSDNCPKLSPNLAPSTTAQPEPPRSSSSSQPQPHPDAPMNASLLVDVDSSYESATRALAEAQRVISSARSAALISMTSQAETATKRSSALEAEIRKLKAALANARARATAAESSSAAVPGMLRVAQEVHDAEVQELKKTHEAELQRRQTAHENDCAWLRARVEMLKAENKTQQKSLHVMQASVAAMRKNVFIESDRAQSAIRDQRKKLVKDLDDIMKLGPGDVKRTNNINDGLVPYGPPGKKRTRAAIPSDPESDADSSSDYEPARKRTVVPSGAARRTAS